MTSQNRATKSPKINDIQATPTFMDHVRELQGRLFSLAIIFLIMAGAAYPFFDLIVNFLVAPLGPEHELVYLTPGGAFSFIIKVCMYVGAVGALPFFIYHAYRFLLPAVKVVNIRRALLYTVLSLVLALIGLSFAYFISLPAALYFLTSFDLHNINPMLTIDSYFSFIITYMLAGALLFQLPLIISIINTIKPLTPGGMMKYQRHLILGSFIIAAIISPTPDALNQALLAMPVVIMYQASIMFIWLVNRKSRQLAVVRSDNYSQPIGRLAIRRAMALPQPAVATVVTIDKPRQQPRSHLSRQTSIDGFAPASKLTAERPARRPVRSLRAEPVRRPAVRGVDGFRISPRQS